MKSQISRVRGRLSFEQIGKVRGIFNKFDHNNGTLEAREFKRFLLNFDVSLTDRQVKELIAVMDTDWDDDNDKHGDDSSDSDNNKDVDQKIEKGERKTIIKTGRSGNGVIEFEELLSWFPTILALKRMNQFKPPSVVAQTATSSSASSSSPQRILRTAPTSRVDWALIRSKLPFSKTDPKETEKRNALFDRMDVNANGFLSLAEVDKGLRDAIQLPSVFNVKPVIMRAFQAAKSVSNAKNNNKGQKTGYATVNSSTNNNKNKGSLLSLASLGPDFVERSEFRLLLKYLFGYFQLWETFEQVDSDGDRRIDQTEFSIAFQTLIESGLVNEAADIGRSDGGGRSSNDSPAAVLFSRLDVNGGGYILFDELVEWAMKRQLFLDC